MQFFRWCSKGIPIQNHQIGLIPLPQPAQRIFLKADPGAARSPCFQGCFHRKGFLSLSQDGLLQAEKGSQTVQPAKRHMSAKIFQGAVCTAGGQICPRLTGAEGEGLFQPPGKGSDS